VEKSCSWGGGGRGLTLDLYAPLRALNLTSSSVSLRIVTSTATAVSMEEASAPQPVRERCSRALKSMGVRWEV
jgi:hypothetical protein